ncbi:MAG: hypothetical protein HC893_04845 [Chloroflexaceae bacterium]|nr:hypothetical protein [Chloroflexaceae bacterium]NJL33296.1 hypothetical protein [Chloroflexaceae bacterium]NJO06790.1 hypothetical protein [Chloroflexaceae bacterium]
MKNIVRFWLTSLALALALALTACGGGGGGGQAPAGGGEEAPAAEEGGEAAEAPAGELTTSPSVEARGEQLLFSAEQLGPVPAGEEVTLSFNNTSTINQHNLLLLNTNDETVAASVNDASAEVGPDAGYVPDAPEIIGHTELLDPGAEGSFAVTIDEPGEYLYICTVPGHYAAGMHGILTVE